MNTQTNFKTEPITLGLPQPRSTSKNPKEVFNNPYKQPLLTIEPPYRDGIGANIIHAGRELLPNTVDTAVHLKAFSASEAGATTQTTTSTSYVDITGMTTSFTLRRKSTVLLFAHVDGYIASGDIYCEMLIRLLLNATDVGKCSVPGRYFSNGGNYSPGNGHIQTVRALDPGDYTLKLQFRTTDATYTAYCDRDKGNIGYAVLGQ